MTDSQHYKNMVIHFMAIVRRVESVNYERTYTSHWSLLRSKALALTAWVVYYVLVKLLEKTYRSCQKRLYHLPQVSFCCYVFSYNKPDVKCMQISNQVQHKTDNVGTSRIPSYKRCTQLVYQIYTTAANTTRHSTHAVFCRVCSPDDEHYDARNMLS